MTLAQSPSKCEHGGMTLTIATVGQVGLGIQGWFGQKPPSPAQVTRPEPSPGPRGKPRGFYTSSWNDTTGSTAWVDYIKQYPDRAGEGRRIWRLWPDPEARLYVIASVQDYETLAEHFPKRWSGSAHSALYAADWSRIPVDGVHVTAAAIEAAKHRQGNAQPEFGGWDVESTVWYKWSFVRQELVGPDI